MRNGEKEEGGWKWECLSCRGYTSLDDGAKWRWIIIYL